MYSTLKNILPATLKRKIKLSVQTFWQSLAYFFFRGRVKISHTRHIVFACKGNVCRSSFAEFYLRSLQLDDNLTIESCGLDVDQGIVSPLDASLVAKEFGVNLSANQSKGLPACDLDQADLVIAMEYDQFKRLVQKFPHKRKQIALLRGFAPWPECLICNIHDPYGCGREEFRICFKAMQRALDGLARQLKQDRKI